MLNHLFASTIILGSVLVLCVYSANGQSLDLQFSGTINTNCTFEPSVTPGELRLLSGDTIGSGESVLFSTGAVFTVKCSAPANVTISAPVQTAGSTLNPVSCGSSLTRGDLSLANIITFNSCDGSSPPASIGSGSTPGIVNMSVKNNGLIPAGTYGYKVTVSVVP